MAVQGNLEDMSLADLIQHNCQDHKTAQLILDEGVLFFRDGAVTHAKYKDQVGEGAVYEMLRLEKGTFVLETGQVAPEASITRSWTSLLLEGARRIDETSPDVSAPVLAEDRLVALLGNMASQLKGYVASVISAADGSTLAQHGAPSESISAQLTLLMKLVETSVGKLHAGKLEDQLLTTRDMYLLSRYLPEKPYFLGIIVGRQSGNLGKLRLLARLYAEQTAQAIANESHVQ